MIQQLGKELLHQLRPGWVGAAATTLMPLVEAIRAHVFLFALQPVLGTAGQFGSSGWGVSWPRYLEFPKPPSYSVRPCPAERFEIQISDQDIAHWQ